MKKIDTYFFLRRYYDRRKDREAGLIKRSVTEISGEEREE